MKHRRRWLLLLAPLLLTGCGALGGSATAEKASSEVAVAEGAGSGDSWLVVARGSATPSPTPSSGVPPYPLPTATGFLPKPTPTKSRPAARCTPYTVHFTRIGSLDVVTGTTTATATWSDVNGYNLIEYRLTALAQDLKPGKQRAIEWVEIPAQENCGTLTATVKGLDPKTGYVLSLDAVVTTNSGEGTRSGTIRRSGVVYTK
ncbi:hypothetical protein AB0M36_03400 [Actinoplanes sp. NPDC051346]|uniref:hypothetical protein n=1 Tax=Actinoplanes sp. NPDC051346 TaxID=3155048 RepID=UPI00344A5C83